MILHKYDDFPPFTSLFGCGCPFTTKPIAARIARAMKKTVLDKLMVENTLLYCVSKVGSRRVIGIVDAFDWVGIGLSSNVAPYPTFR